MNINTTRYPYYIVRIHKGEEYSASMYSSEDSARTAKRKALKRLHDGDSVTISIVESETKSSIISKTFLCVIK